MERKIMPYGSWKSPITSELILKDTVALKGSLMKEMIFIGLNAFLLKAAAAGS